MLNMKNYLNVNRCFHALRYTVYFQDHILLLAVKMMGLKNKNRCFVHLVETPKALSQGNQISDYRFRSEQKGYYSVPKTTKSTKVLA